MVGMLRKEFFDFLAVSVQLPLQEAELFGAGHRETALGLGKGFGSAKVGGFGEELQAPLVGLLSVKFRGVKEFVESGVCPRWLGSVHS